MISRSRAYARTGTLEKNCGGLAGPGKVAYRHCSISLLPIGNVKVDDDRWMPGGESGPQHNFKGGKYVR